MGLRHSFGVFCLVFFVLLRRSSLEPEQRKYDLALENKMILVSLLHLWSWLSSQLLM